MNSVIDHLANHRSIRSYKDQPIEKKLLQTILQTAQKAPSSINGQQCSVIVIEDKDTKARLAACARHQPWIYEAPVFAIFVMDFYRASIAAKKWGREFKFVDSTTALIVGTFDAGLAMQNVITAAESEGLGTVPIGGILLDTEEVAKILDLPEYVFPLCGLCMGYPKETPLQKPRFPSEAVIHQGKYHKENMEEIIREYDEEMSQYLEKINLEEEISWSQKTSIYYQENYAPNLTQALKKSGFSLEDK